MASQGPLYAGSGADDSSVGTLTWSSPGAITAEGSPKAFAQGKSATTHYLVATTFGFSIPAGSTVNGIMAEVRCLRSSSELLAWATDSRVRIIKGGVIGSTDRSSADPWPEDDEYRIYGSSSDLWGETWSVSDINAAGFGLAFSAVFGAAKFEGRADVDAVRITVTYTPPPGHPAVKRMGGVRYAHRLGQGVW